MYYFKKDSPADGDLPEDGISLENAWVMDGDIGSGKPYCISIVTPKRTYFLCSSSDQEKREWDTALTGVVERLNPQRLVDFSQLLQPEPIQPQSNVGGDDSE